MNRKRKQLFNGIVMALIMAVLTPLGQITSYAAGAQISFSDPSVTVGKEVSVTMKVTSSQPLGVAEITLAYDDDLLEFTDGANAKGGAGSIKVLGTTESADQKVFSFSLKFKALKTGTASITVLSEEVYDIDGQAIPVDKKGTSAVAIAPLATYSKDATLKSLKISPGTLTPEFSPSVENYTASVGADVTKLIVSSEAADGGANVVIQGSNDLKAGENQVVCRVTAEDGQTVKNYTILVTKAEGGAENGSEGPEDAGSAQLGGLKVMIGEKEYAVASSFDESTLPEGFEASAYTYKGNEVTAGKGIEKPLTLLYLADGEGNGGFYIYNEETDGWCPFVSVDTSAKSIVVVPLDAGVTVPSGFAARKIAIGDKEVDGWIWEGDTEKEKQYCVFYGMNWNGEKNFYRYDLSEGTIQRYFRDPSGGGVSMEDYAKVAGDYNNLIRDYDMQFIIIIVLLVIAAALFVLVIVLLMKKGGGRRGPDPYRDENRYSSYEEPDRGGRVSRASVREQEHMDLESVRRIPDPSPRQSRRGEEHGYREAGEAFPAQASEAFPAQAGGAFPAQAGGALGREPALSQGAGGLEQERRAARQTEAPRQRQTEAPRQRQTAEPPRAFQGAGPAGPSEVSDAQSVWEARSARQAGASAKGAGHPAGGVAPYESRGAQASSARDGSGIRRPKVSKYTRQEWDMMNENASSRKNSGGEQGFPPASREPQDSGEEDFEMAGSLEEMEQALSSRLAKGSEGGTRESAAPFPEEEPDDDFEFMNLDD